MRSGKLRDLVTIQRRTPSADATWGAAAGETWADVVELWADVQSVDGSEQLRSGAGVESVATHQVRTRFLAGVTVQDRIAWRGRTLNIVSIAEDPRRTELVIAAAEHRQA